MSRDDLDFNENNLNENSSTTTDDEEIEGAMVGGYEGEPQYLDDELSGYTKYLADSKSQPTEAMTNVVTDEPAYHNDSLANTEVSSSQTNAGTAFALTDGSKTDTSDSSGSTESTFQTSNTQSDSTDILNNKSDDSQNSDDTENNPEAHSAISADLIRGHINTIILRALYERDKYGYEIINDIEGKSHGQYTLKQPTLYSALKRLETQGYIKAYWKKDDISSGGRRKYFTLTEAGKEMTEKNLAEWEYSRTIIDSLISDKAFDFTRPAPTPVDFAILRDSVSRVPNLKHSSDEDNSQPDISEISSETAKNACTLQYVMQGQNVDSHAISESITSTYTDDQKNQERQGQESCLTDENARQYGEVIRRETEQTKGFVNLQPSVDTPPVYTNNTERTATQTANKESSSSSVNIDDNAATTQPPSGAQTYTYNNATSFERTASSIAEEERARQIAHENYLRLISTPVPQTSGKDASQASSAGKDVIYTNRPAPERDYRNLIDKIYSKALANGSEQTSFYADNTHTELTGQRATTLPIVDRGSSDGLKVMPSTDRRTPSQSTAKTVYDKGKTLLKCSAIVLFVLFIEFIVCLALMSPLEIPWAYPIVLLLIGIVQFAVFAYLNYRGIFGHSAKPASSSYLTTSIIITIIAVLIICVLAFLLNVNFTVAGDIVKYMVMPSITALNITIFATSFYILVR